MRQPLFPSNAVDDQRPKVDVKLLAVPIAFALLAALGTYYLVNAYLLHQARQNVRDILLSHRGLHLYIQRTMHEEFYRARTNQEISMAYYAPEILSSSFMVRVLHGYYNEERQRAGLPPVYYKMAADNPRNPVNQTDAAEAKLLEYFRDHPEVREYSEVEKMNGKTCLVFAMPFLRTEERCLVCHGKREEAPEGLQARYPQAGGYGEALGELRAIESLRIPIEEEKLTAMIGTLAALAGFGAVGGLLVFNRILNRTVRSRTAELASRERTVRRLLDAAESVPFEYMPETGRYTYVGPQFREIFGAEPSVLKTGEDWEAMVHPSDRKTTLRACREATLRGEDHDCLLKIVAFDGRLKLIHQTVNIVQEAGKPLQVVGFLHDVTEQRRSEALQGARLAIAESAVELGMDDVILRLVDEVERLTASRVGFFHFVDDTQRKIVLQAWSTNTPAAFRVEEKGAYLPMDSAGAWSECLAQRTTLVRNEAAAYKSDARPGAPLHRELLHPIMHDGNPVALIGVGNKDADYDAFDVALVGQLAGLVTEAIMRKRAEEEKVRLRVQLIQAQKLESIGRLAGGVAHDFNNVLAAMMMQLSFLQQKPDFDLETREALVELTTEAQRAASLTRQLLMFSRRSVLQRKVLDLNGVVASLMNMLGRLIGEHIKIKFERGESLPLVEADQGMVEQVVMNLAVNARDAMPQGGTLDIRLTNVEVDRQRAVQHPEARPGSFVCLSVTDSGCGMDDATLRRVFEPFFTTKEAGKGTGLGLATVHGIVAQHKGWIEVQSAVGLGSSFHVFFPATTAAGTGMAEQNPPAFRGHEAILLVEDEALLRRSVARGLRALGYTVFESANGPEALEAWDRAHGRIDLLLTDMVMPEGMSGFELAHALRRQQVNLKVMITSGYNEELAGSDVRNQTDMVYLQKPYTVEELSRAIRGCLDRV